MRQYRFYHLTSTPLVKALGDLAVKAVALGHKILVLAGTPAQVKTLDDGLWTWRQDAFLPHGCLNDPAPARTPVWITAEASDVAAPPNNADTLILTHVLTHGAGVDSKESHFALICDMFDGADEAQLAGARARWKTLKDAGGAPSYFQQNETGAWVQK